jgi:hypothetical protein
VSGNQRHGRARHLAKRHSRPTLRA